MVFHLIHHCCGGSLLKSHTKLWYWFLGLCYLLYLRLCNLLTNELSDRFHPVLMSIELDTFYFITMVVVSYSVALFRKGAF